ncbi:hypothetical protein EGR_03707 [Echinococcus granulosus]|uniref:Uncharacterized protein n=1 Tax=Echinococcus granulosus TaxID=6210 RepID=W6USS0_ECHGR|nr:hypothetical protein EGR_03707 [Echinococcus granulosus]EUB61417.1 hypothetical protein EGR_03707 [Echinococcus granulosus]
MLKFNFFAAQNAQAYVWSFKCGLCGGELADHLSGPNEKSNFFNPNVYRHLNTNFGHIHVTHEEKLSPSLLHLQRCQYLALKVSTFCKKLLLTQI